MKSLVDLKEKELSNKVGNILFILALLFWELWIILGDNKTKIYLSAVFGLILILLLNLLAIKVLFNGIDKPLYLKISDNND